MHLESKSWADEQEKDGNKLRYRFVVIFLPLMNLVEVDTDLKLPIPPPPPPKDEEEKEVMPPTPMSPNELKPNINSIKKGLN